MNWDNEPELTDRLSLQCRNWDNELVSTSSLPSECRDSILNRSIVSNISNVVSRSDASRWSQIKRNTELHSSKMTSSKSSLQ